MPDDRYFTDQQRPSTSNLNTCSPSMSGPTRSPAPDEDIVLTSIGLIFDRGLCADGVPAEQWAEHASGAVNVVDDVYLATLTSEEWEGPEASQVMTVAEAIGDLLYLVSARGTDLFRNLTLRDRHALSTASRLIATVSQRFFEQLADEPPA